MDDKIEAAASLMAATLARIIISHGKDVALEALELAITASFDQDSHAPAQADKPVNDLDA